VESREARLGGICRGERVGGWVKAFLEDEDDSLGVIEGGRCVELDLSARIYQEDVVCMDE
jgi:hypothetical protein